MSMNKVTSVSKKMAYTKKTGQSYPKSGGASQITCIARNDTYHSCGKLAQERGTA